MKNHLEIEFLQESLWTWIINKECPSEHIKSMEEEVKKEFHGSIGKYLFFSSDKELLVELAQELLIKYKLHHAKVPTSMRPGYSKYVLCVYDVGENFSDEMKQYQTETIEYGYWRSDEDTLKGIE